RAGGPGEAPGLIMIGLLAGGVLALLWSERRRQTLLIWLVGLVGLAFAALGAGGTFTPATLSDPVGVWVGLPVTCWLAAMAAAGGIAADGGIGRLARRIAVIGRPVVTVVAIAAVLAPVLAGGWWLVRTTEDPLSRSTPTEVPAYLAARAQAGSATLTVSGTATEGIQYDLYRNGGDRLGDEAVAADAADAAAMSRTVTELFSTPTTAQLETLAAHGVGAIYLAPPADTELAQTLDSTPG